MRSVGIRIVSFLGLSPERSVIGFNGFHPVSPKHRHNDVQQQNRIRGPLQRPRLSDSETFPQQQRQIEADRVE
jgi:hypothetical protein